MVAHAGGFVFCRRHQEGAWRAFAWTGMATASPSLTEAFGSGSAIAYARLICETSILDFLIKVNF